MRVRWEKRTSQRERAKAMKEGRSELIDWQKKWADRRRRRGREFVVITVARVGGLLHFQPKRHERQNAGEEERTARPTE